MTAAELHHELEKEQEAVVCATTMDIPQDFISSGTGPPVC